jgi:hypothetical protein
MALTLSMTDLLAQVLCGWGVKLNNDRAHTFASAVAHWMQHCSRTRLIELLKVMVKLGIRVHHLGKCGSSCRALPAIMEGSAASVMRNECDTQDLLEAADCLYSIRLCCDDSPMKEESVSEAGNRHPGDAWLCAFLECFLSRNFRQPLFRHQADLATALSALCCEPAVHYSHKASPSLASLSERTKEFSPSPAAVQLLRQALTISEGRKHDFIIAPLSHWLHDVPHVDRLKA